VVATVAGGFAPVVGAPVIAIVIGIVVAALRRPSDRLQPGLAFTGKKVLQASIVVLGLGLSFHQVLSTGERSLPVLVGTLLIALCVAWAASRALRLPGDVTTLVGMGTAICGASAIAATDAVIGADEADVSYAVATIFTFNVIAVLAYPSLGHALGLSQPAFGLWAGTAINDVSSVVAASTVYGHAAASYAVVVKLSRTLAIIPIGLGLAALRGRRKADSDAPPAAAPGAPSVLRHLLPLFVLGFVAAVALDTAGLVPNSWHPGLADVATWMITAALAAHRLVDQTRPHPDRRRPAAAPRSQLVGDRRWSQPAAPDGHRVDLSPPARLGSRPHPQPRARPTCPYRYLSDPALGAAVASRSTPPLSLAACDSAGTACTSARRRFAPFELGCSPWGDRQHGPSRSGWGVPNHCHEQTGEVFAQAAATMVDLNDVTSRAAVAGRTMRHRRHRLRPARPPLLAGPGQRRHRGHGRRRRALPGRGQGRGGDRVRQRGNPAQPGLGRPPHRFRHRRR
jgi:uncharacterized integral membrane protein (TIGR00698 family)